jgi:hypothetical protein
MALTTTGTPFSLNIPGLVTDLADFFNSYLVPNMTAINTYAAHKGTAQTFSALQTFSAGVTVSSGGASITGNSSITGTLGSLTGLTVASGGATITAGGLTVTAGGATITAGGLTITAGTIAFPLGSAASPSIIPATDTNTGMWSPAADTLAWSTAGTERVRVDSSGNVGIGTTSPATALEVNGTIRFTAETGNVLQFGTSGGPYRRITTEINASGGTDLSFYNSSGGNAYGAFTFRAQDTSVRSMTILASGNVGIGTSTPAYQLELSTNSAAKPTSSAWTVSSDARLKTVLGPYTVGLAEVLTLAPKRYRLNGEYGSVDDNLEHVSIIAQDALAVWPGMIGT